MGTPAGVPTVERDVFVGFPTVAPDVFVKRETVYMTSVQSLFGPMDCSQEPNPEDIRYCMICCFALNGQAQWDNHLISYKHRKYVRYMKCHRLVVVLLSKFVVDMKWRRLVALLVSKFVVDQKWRRLVVLLLSRGQAICYI